MNTNHLRQMLAAVAVAGITSSALPSAAAQRGQTTTPSVEKARPAAAPRTADGKVDFSGIWSPDRNFIYDIHDALEKGAELPLQPWAEKLARERLSKDDPEALCLPTGVPRQALLIRGGSCKPRRTCSSCSKATFTAIARFSSTAGSIRRIPIRPGTATPWPDGKATRWSWIPSGSTTSSGSTSRGTLTRNSCTSSSAIGVRISITSTTTPRSRMPGAYTKPFTMHGHSTYQHNDELMEYICNENNKDVAHIVGKDPRNKYSKP